MAWPRLDQQLARLTVAFPVMVALRAHALLAAEANEKRAASKARAVPVSSNTLAHARCAVTLNTRNVPRGGADVGRAGDAAAVQLVELGCQVRTIVRELAACTGEFPHPLRRPATCSRGEALGQWCGAGRGPAVTVATAAAIEVKRTSCARVRALMACERAAWAWWRLRGFGRSGRSTTLAHALIRISCAGGVEIAGWQCCFDAACAGLSRLSRVERGRVEAIAYGMLALCKHLTCESLAHPLSADALSGIDCGGSGCFAMGRSSNVCERLHSSTCCTQQGDGARAGSVEGWFGGHFRMAGGMKTSPSGVVGPAGVITRIICFRRAHSACLDVLHAGVAGEREKDFRGVCCTGYAGPAAPGSYPLPPWDSADALQPLDTAQVPNSTSRLNRSRDT